MELEYQDGIIVLQNKIVNTLDEFVFDIVKLVEPIGDYCIVSGYVVILFGRTRSTEDVDILISNIDKVTFSRFYNNCINSGFHFINPEDEKGLFDMLQEGLAIRIARTDQVIPNIELKVSKGIGRETMVRRVKVKVNDKLLYISPIELQIAYKLYLGSEKDIEDAIYLYGIFQDHLDIEKLRTHKKTLGLEGNIYGI